MFVVNKCSYNKLRWHVCAHASSHSGDPQLSMNTHVLSGGFLDFPACLWAAGEQALWSSERCLQHSVSAEVGRVAAPGQLGFGGLQGAEQSKGNPLPQKEGRKQLAAGQKAVS